MVRNLSFQSDIKAMSLNIFFLPCLGSDSLEMNSRGFQQVPLPQPSESKTDSAALSCYDPTQPKAALHPAKMRALAPLSSSLILHPRISSDMKPSHLSWAPGLGTCPRSSEADASILLPTCGSSVSPQLGTLGSFFEIVIFLLSQCLAWGPSPRSICKQDWLT